MHFDIPDGLIQIELIFVYKQVSVRNGGRHVQQTVITDQKVCKIIGNPDFNLKECRFCREDADPVYKQCLTLRVTDIAENIRPKSDHIGFGSQVSIRL